MLHPIDIHVGLRVRQRRALLGMTQTDLGKAVGLTFQQVQKYERGANRVSASRLFEFSCVLDVPVPYFFEGMDSETSSGRQKPGRSKKVAGKGENAAFSGKRETLTLVRAYYKIRDAHQRKSLTKLVTALAEETPAKRPRSSR